MGYSAPLLALAQKLNQEVPSQPSVSLSQPSLNPSQHSMNLELPSVNPVQPTVNHPQSFAQPPPSVNIEYVTMATVSKPLNTLVIKEDMDIFDLNDEADVIDMKSGLCNHPDITSCNWDVCAKLKELRIGDRCLENVMAFVLKDLVKLERVEIGCSCFTKAKGRMEVSGCGMLKSLKIGNDSCEKWSEFVTRDCGVEEVEIGDGCFADCENTVFEGKDEE